MKPTALIRVRSSLRMSTHIIKSQGRIEHWQQLQVIPQWVVSHAKQPLRKKTTRSSPIVGHDEISGRASGGMALAILQGCTLKFI